MGFIVNVCYIIFLCFLVSPLPALGTVETETVLVMEYVTQRPTNANVLKVGQVKAVTFQTVQMTVEPLVIV